MVWWLAQTFSVGAKAGTKQPESIVKKSKERTSLPDAPCMEYLPTFTPKMTQM